MAGAATASQECEEPCLTHSKHSTLSYDSCSVRASATSKTAPGGTEERRRTLFSPPIGLHTHSISWVEH